MNTRMIALIDAIGSEYQGHIEKGSRHYMEVNLGKRASELGFIELAERFTGTQVIVPLKEPQRGMKVRIDGRTFANYAEHPTGIAVPDYVAKEAGSVFGRFVPGDSMICNFA